MADDAVKMTLEFDGQTIGPFTKSDLDRVTRSLNRAPMKADPDFRRHNQHAFDVTADELRQLIERIEQLAEERADIAAQVKEVFAEAKGRGYDTKVMRKLIARRRRKPDEVAEEEAVMDMYLHALGMA